MLGGEVYLKLQNEICCLSKFNYLQHCFQLIRPYFMTAFSISFREPALIFLSFPSRHGTSSPTIYLRGNQANPPQIFPKFASKYSFSNHPSLVLNFLSLRKLSCSTGNFSISMIKASNLLFPAGVNFLLISPVSEVDKYLLQQIRS